jgi:hypothetical protein
MGTGSGLGGRGFRGFTRSAPSRSRALRKLPDGNFRRPLVGSLRALTSAEMAALRCTTAARIGFLLAALHSVAERVNPRKPRPPAPHQSPLASQRGNVPHSAAEGKSRETRWRAKRQDAQCLRSSPPLGHMPRWLLNGNGAAGRDGGGVDCSLRERAWRAASERRPARSSSLVVLPDRRVSTHPVERCQLQRASRATSERGRFRASAQESSKRARPARSRRLQSTPPPPQPHRSVPVC